MSGRSAAVAFGGPGWSQGGGVDPVDAAVVAGGDDRPRVRLREISLCLLLLGIIERIHEETVRTNEAQLGQDLAELASAVERVTDDIEVFDRGGATPADPASRSRVQSARWRSETCWTLITPERFNVSEPAWSADMLMGDLDETN